MDKKIYEKKLSIIILNYKTEKLTAQTVDSVLATVKTENYEIYIVDNNSADGSLEHLMEKYAEDNRIKFIANSENVGFAKGNNIAIKDSTSEYVLLLNSDTIVYEGTIDKCVEYMDNNEEVGAMGPKVVLEDGSLDHACKRGFPTPSASLYYMLKLDKIFNNKEKYGKYDMTYLPIDEINEVDALTGAFMMVRRQVIDTVGTLDERFFMYAEDIDWCYRIKWAGWKIIYYPEVTMLHLKGKSGKKRKYRTIYQFHKTMLQFYDKNYKPSYNLAVTAAVHAGVWLKCGLTMVVNVFKK